jgi:hypothetical protein
MIVSAFKFSKDLKITFLLSLFVTIIMLTFSSDNESFLIKFINISFHIWFKTDSDFNSFFYLFLHIVLASHWKQFLMNLQIHKTYSDQKKCYCINVNVISRFKCSVIIESCINCINWVRRNLESETHFLSLYKSSSWSFTKHSVMNVLISNQAENLKRSFWTALISSASTSSLFFSWFYKSFISIFVNNVSRIIIKVKMLCSAQSRSKKVFILIETTSVLSLNNFNFSNNIFWCV